MKKIACAVLLLMAGFLKAQTTVVTATISDPDHIAWANGTWNVQLAGNAGTFTQGGVPVPQQYYVKHGNMDASGILTVTLADTTLMDQQAYYIFSLSSNTSDHTINQISTPVYGATLNLSSVLSAGVKSPRFPAGQFAFGYADIEAVGQGPGLPPPNDGASYFQLPCACFRSYSVKTNSWSGSSGGGSSGFPIVLGSTSIAASSTTGSITGVTVNGVTPTTMSYLDPTSSVQTQLNSKQGSLTLTTTGSSGASTLVGNTLNIPQYSGGGGSGTVTTFSAGNLSPIFTTSVATATTTPALSFSLNNVGAHNFLGNNSGGTATPNFVQPAFSDLSGTASNTQIIGWNGVTVSSLATGLLKNTTGTGAPSIAALSDLTTLGAAPAASPTFTGTVTTPITGGGTQCVHVSNTGVISGTGADCGTGSGGATIQTNGVNNSSQATLNFITSTVNATGLTITPSNPTSGNEKLELTGTINAANVPTLNQNTTGSAASLSSALALSGLATQAANTIVGNGTGSTAVPTALAIPSCSAGTSALTWTSGTGFGCNTISSGSSSWSSLTNPSTALSLSMGNANISTFTAGAATSTNNMFTFTDTASNTGTGILGRFTTASGSAATPWQADVNGLGWKVASNGTLSNVGSSASGNVALSGSTSGTANITVQAAAGTPTITLGTSSGTPAVTASSPLAITTATGNITCTTCTTTIASGTSALGTSAIASGACATVVTTSATGTASTDAIIWNPNASIKGVTGYVPSTSGGLTIAAYPTTNNVNFDVCNWTSASITPGAVTLNWRVVR